jgi:molybdopterin-containing oxidoreductase family membrane subunit
MLRQRVTGWKRVVYTILSWGWRGTQPEWKRMKEADALFSVLILPVVISVHTIVSWDFAVTIQPGWHSTIFGPYFIVGALFSGAAAVLLILIIVRKAMHLEYFLRDEHFNGMAVFILLLSFTWAYFYFNDYLIPWYGGEPVDKVLQSMLAQGIYTRLWYLMLFSNVVLPAITLWSRRIRTSPAALFFICIFIQIGMYLERYLIVPGSLARNNLPFDWGLYIPRIPESLITVAAFALVGFLYVLLSRIVPLIPVWEVYEGQVLQGLRRIGRSLVPTRAEPESE